MVSEELLDEIKKITGIDLSYTIYNFIYFMDFYYPDIINYYSGLTSVPNGDSFKKLNILLDESKTLINILNLNKQSFSSVEIHILLENIEEMHTKLCIIDNISKFLRSTIVKGQFNLGVIDQVSLNYNETLEKLSRRINSINSDNDWVDSAIKNDLIEEDYTPDGGVILKVVYNNAPGGISNMLSIVDNIEGEKMYGLDIDRNLSFIDNDLKILTYKETINQSIDIKLGLKQGDVPEFPRDGIQLNQTIGSNINSVQFPILFRQLSSLFSKDDSISSFSIKNFIIQGDATLIDIEINTRYNEQFQRQIQIT